MPNRLFTVFYNEETGTFQMNELTDDGYEEYNSDKFEGSGMWTDWGDPMSCEDVWVFLGKLEGTG